MTDEQIKHMVDRFLGWRLPESFNPDGGIKYQRDWSPDIGRHSMPIGTNLFTATEADAMVRHMIEGLAGTEELLREATVLLAKIDHTVSVHGKMDADTELHRAIDHALEVLDPSGSALIYPNEDPSGQRREPSEIGWMGDVGGNPYGPFDR